MLCLSYPGRWHGTAVSNLITSTASGLHHAMYYLCSVVCDHRACISLGWRIITDTVCVFFKLNRSSTHRHHPKEIQALWSQTATQRCGTRKKIIQLATVTNIQQHAFLARNISYLVVAPRPTHIDNAKPWHRAGYFKHSIHTPATQYTERENNERKTKNKGKRRNYTPRTNQNGHAC